MECNIDKFFNVCMDQKKNCELFNKCHDSFIFHLTRVRITNLYAEEMEEVDPEYTKKLENVYNNLASKILKESIQKNSEEQFLNSYITGKNGYPILMRSLIEALSYQCKN